ncbi:MAG: protein kinase [Bacteroidota bacterium]
MIEKTPVIVLAFANEFTDKGFLRHLTHEMKELLKVLEPAVQKGRCLIKLIPSATQDDIAAVFQDEWYQGRIWIFHYGGHADEDELWLEDGTGGNKSFFSLGLAKFLGAQEGLKLVFLNACATGDHGKLLLDAGVPSVVVTSRRIEDEQARTFARGFYQGLAGGASILEAYKEAEGLVLGAWGTFSQQDGGEGDMTRSLFWKYKDPEEPDFPWRMHHQGGSNLFVDYWRLFYELNPALSSELLENEDFIGKKIQNYTIDSYLGQGRFGSVYKAIHTNLNKEVAIKISHPVKEGFEELKSIIFSGNKGLSSLRHPNVVAFYDAGEIDFGGDRRIYVIMELINGKGLNKMDFGVPFLDRNELAELADKAIQICSGLEAAHTAKFTDALGMPREGFIHGNLKRRKILFTPDGIPKIIDFLFADIARSHNIEMEVPESVKEFAKTERLEDTYPPEVISGAQSINKQTDIYSFGSVMVEILLSKQLSELEFKTLKDLEELLKASNSKIPGYIPKIVHQAIHPNPSLRTQHFSEIIDAFMKPRSWFKRISYLLRKKI